jgi:hypothetical protein
MDYFVIATFDEELGFTEIEFPIGITVDFHYHKAITIGPHRDKELSLFSRLGNMDIIGDVDPDAIAATGSEYLEGDGIIYRGFVYKRGYDRDLDAIVHHR